MSRKVIISVWIILLMLVGTFGYIIGMKSVDAEDSISAPMRVTAIASDTQIMILWGEVPNADGYNIYRSTKSDGNFTRINSALITNTTYTDTTVSNETVYYYYVTAVLKDTESNFSNMAGPVLLGVVVS